MKNRTHKAVKRAERERMIEQGMFDGRFRTRRVKSEKKEASRNACRKYRYVSTV